MSKTIHKNYRNCPYVSDCKKPRSLREIKQTTNAIEELKEYGFDNRSRDLKRTKLPSCWDDIYLSSNKAIPQRNVFTLDLNLCKEVVSSSRCPIHSIKVYKVNSQGALKLDLIIISDFLSELAKLNNEFLFDIIYKI